MASTQAGKPPFGPGAARKRPRETEDPLNLFLYHPLAASLARSLQPTGVSPNAVSVAGMFCIWSAAACYFLLPWPQSALFGLCLHMLWHVVDGADGDLARLTGRSSPTGELVDGVCDYAGHSLLYVALAAMTDDVIGLWAWPVAALAAASHAAQANHAESQRRTYLWLAYGVPWLKQARSAGAEVFTASKGLTRTFSGPARIYLWAANAMTPNIAALDAAVADAATDPHRLKLIRRLVRRSSRRSLIFQKAIGSNPRTLILGACMAFGSPLAFFLVQIFALNVVLIVSVIHHGRVNRILARKIGRGTTIDADGEGALTIMR